MKKMEKMTVSQRIIEIIKDLPAIGKDERLQGGSGYAYRGIEQMTAALQPLLGKHGVHFVPHVRSWELVEISANGRPWQEARLLVAYTIYGADGDSVEVGPTLGIGRDNADKAANKAMTAAFKYALLQTFGVSDRADDGDAERVENATPTKADLSEETAALLADLNGVSEAVRNHCREYVKGKKFPTFPSKWNSEQVAEIRSELEAALGMEADAKAAESIEPETV